MNPGLLGSSSNQGSFTGSGQSSGFTPTYGTTGTSGKSAWEVIFGNLGGVLTGAGSLVTSLKADPNEIARANAQASANNWQSMLGLSSLQGGNRNNNTIIWVIGIVLLVVVVLFFAFRK